MVSSSKAPKPSRSAVTTATWLTPTGSLTADSGSDPHALKAFTGMEQFVPSQSASRRCARKNARLHTNAHPQRSEP